MLAAGMHRAPERQPWRFTGRCEGWDLLLSGLRRLSVRRPGASQDGTGTGPGEARGTVLAVSAAVGIAIIGAALWGLVAMLFKTQLSLFGLLIGGGVGLAVARYRGPHWPTVVAGAVIAVAGCALGTLLGLVFVLLDAGFSLPFVLGHLGGPSGVLHYFPSSVGVLGLVFWAVAAFAAVWIPRRGLRPASPADSAPADSEPADITPADSTPAEGAPADGSAEPADGNGGAESES